MNKINSITVFCGSSEGNDTDVLDQAVLLGETLASNNTILVYGAAKIGVMGKIAEATIK